MAEPAGRKPFRVLVRLWSINRWLRWTGWRLLIDLPVENGVIVDGPTTIGLVWYGWSFVGHEPARGRFS